MTPRTLVEELLVGLRQPALVLHDEAATDVAASLPDDRISRHAVGGSIPGVPRRWPVVLLVVENAVSLRRAASFLPPLGRTWVVGCWLLDSDSPALVVPRPEWPTVVELRAHADGGGGGALTVLRHDGLVGATAVLAELARAVSPTPTGSRGLVLGTSVAEARRVAPPADPGLVVGGTAAELGDPERPVPPDAVLVDDPALVLAVHPVLGRPPVVVSDPLLLTGPLDEGLLNPTGFRRRATQDVIDLDAVLAPQDEVTPRLVARLRDHRGVQVDWEAGDPVTTARATAALAMSGVPVISGPLAPECAVRLGPGLAAALGTGVDLDDDRDREEHSVRLRRAALLHHSGLGWRARAAALAGVPYRIFPDVSVLLTTTTPEDLEVVLGELERQHVRGLEIVVVAAGVAQQLRPDRMTALPVTLVPVPDGRDPRADLPRALTAASGDVVLLLPTLAELGPELVGDLLLARHYSGAAVVEAADELVDAGNGSVHRRSIRTECAVTELSGGPVLASRALMQASGALGPEALGGVVRQQGHHLYRTHGLGHVARSI